MASVGIPLNKAGHSTFNPPSSASFRGREPGLNFCPPFHHLRSSSIPSSSTITASILSRPNSPTVVQSLHRYIQTSEISYFVATLIQSLQQLPTSPAFLHLHSATIVTTLSTNLNCFCIPLAWSIGLKAFLRTLSVHTRSNHPLFPIYLGGNKESGFSLGSGKDLEFHLLKNGGKSNTQSRLSIVATRSTCQE